MMTTDRNHSVACFQLSQVHQSRAMAPIGQYYFLFDQDELHEPLCGNIIPKTFRSESNRIRLNFTSDTSITAKGFSLNWTAGII
jgi:hypothetical protein